jgi:hypothetical protein
MSRLSERIARVKEALRELEQQRRLNVVLAPWAQPECPPDAQNGPRIDDERTDHVDGADR